MLTVLFLVVIVQGSQGAQGTPGPQGNPGDEVVYIFLPLIGFSLTGELRAFFDRNPV